jgi:K+-transporting ATPase KdpF subunit
VRGARHRQQLGEALNDRQQNDVRKTHGVILLTACGVIGLFLWLLYFAYGSIDGSSRGISPLRDKAREFRYGRVVHRADRRARALDRRRHRAVYAAHEAAMTTLYWIALIVSLALLGYLLYALLKAEDF